ncbi:hypothetical protein THAOC_20012, partial [Thalassiosira oceanica]
RRVELRGACTPVPRRLSPRRPRRILEAVPQVGQPSRTARDTADHTPASFSLVPMYVTSSKAVAGWHPSRCVRLEPSESVEKSDGPLAMPMMRDVGAVLPSPPPAALPVAVPRHGRRDTLANQPFDRGEHAGQPRPDLAALVILAGQGHLDAVRITAVETSPRWHGSTTSTTAPSDAVVRSLVHLIYKDRTFHGRTGLDFRSGGQVGQVGPDVPNVPAWTGPTCRLR